MGDLRHILGIRSTIQIASVDHFKSAVEVYDNLFFAKQFPSIGHVVTSDILRFEILELLSVVKVEQQVLLILRSFDLSFLRPDDVRILKAFGKVVDQDIGHHTGFFIFMLHIDVVSFDLRIEHPFGDIQLR